ncbi:hypothetical protein pipiens_008979 [Culex pipiens pipiens]|uniref:Uncharacterized protein n=1 Tax=Culex pipiens pipiens TaxID=38569 RepID=A0ABD1DHE4_CULPP
MFFSPVVVRSSVAECVKVREKKSGAPLRNLCPRRKKWPLVATGTPTTCENPHPRRVRSGTVPEKDSPVRSVECCIRLVPRSNNQTEREKTTQTL